MHMHSRGIERLLSVSRSVCLTVCLSASLENDECLIVELSVNEEELEDERDRGQVDIKNVALIRLQDIRRFFFYVWGPCCIS